MKWSVCAQNAHKTLCKTQKNTKHESRKNEYKAEEEEIKQEKKLFQDTQLRQKRKIIRSGKNVPERG